MSEGTHRIIGARSSICNTLQAVAKLVQMNLAMRELEHSVITTLKEGF